MLEKALSRVAPVLLAVGLAIAIVIQSGCGGDAKPTLYQQYGQGVAGAEAFVEDVTALMQSIPPKDRHVYASPQNLPLWEYEILPYFDYEGVTNTPKAPTFFDNQPSVSGMDHFHNLGWAACSKFLDLYKQPHPVHLNFRLFNPVSPWYGDSERYIPTLIHELAHINGLCDHGWVDENAAQIVTMEIGAAMVNGGNLQVLYAMLSEYRSVAMGYLMYEALLAKAEGDEDALDEFFSWRRSVALDDVEVQRFSKSWRHWNETPMLEVQYRGILHDYSWTVWTGLQEAMKTGFSPEIYLPFYSETPGAITDILAEKQYEGTRRYQMDDFVSLLKNMKALSDDVGVRR